MLTKIGGLYLSLFVVGWLIEQLLMDENIADNAPSEERSRPLTKKISQLIYVGTGNYTCVLGE